MFLKILKTDLKCYSRNFLSVMVGAIAAVFLLSISKFMLNMTDSLLMIIDSVMLLGFVSVYMYIMIMAIKIFKKKFISEEAYLTFSLPVDKYQHLLSTMIVTLVWTAIFGVVMLTMIIWQFREFEFVLAIKNIFDYLKNSYILGVFNVINICVSNISSLCAIYLCCTIPYTVYFRKWPKFIGIVFYVIFSTLQMYTDKLFAKEFYWMISSHGEVFSIIINILTSLVYSFIWFLLCVHLLDKKVEID